MQVSEFPAYTGSMASAILVKAAAAASNAMAAEMQNELVTVTLRQSSHKKGTVTTAAPGEPPALVTGTLRRSVRIVPASSGAPEATASVRVDAAYARIQEHGGFIFAKRARYLRFAYPKGKWHQVRWVHLPARPYMAPTRERLERSGRLKARAAQAVFGAAKGTSGG